LVPPDIVLRVITRQDWQPWQARRSSGVYIPKAKTIDDVGSFGGTACITVELGDAKPEGSPVSP